MELGIGLTKIIPPIVYAVAIIVVLLTLFYRAEIGVFYIIPLLTLQNVVEYLTKYPGGKDIMDILFLVVLMKWFFTRDKSDTIMKSNKNLNYIILAIFIWTFIGLWIGSFQLGTGQPITTNNPRFMHWKNFIMLPLLYFIVATNIKDTKHVKWILLLMAITMLYMDRSFYNNFMDKDTSHYDKDLRVGSTFSYLGPNETAVFYAQNTIIMVCILLTRKDFWNKLIYGLTTGFNYFCLIFLYSRGGYMAALASLMFYSFIKNRVLLGILVIFLVFWRVFVPTSVQERIDMSKTDKGTDHSITARYELWEEAKILILANPVTGMGYATTPYLHFTTDGTQKRKSLHNGYIEVTLELGIIGMIIFLAFYAMSFSYGWKLYKTTKDPVLKGYGLGFMGCVLAVLAGNIAGSYFFYINVSGYYWVNLGLIARTIELEKNSNNKEDKPEEEKVKVRPRSLKKELRPRRITEHKLMGND